MSKYKASHEQVTSFLDNIIVPRGQMIGQTPSLLFCNPKHAHNIGGGVRAASCYGFKQVWYTGNRINQGLEEKRRLPREERMKTYAPVTLHNSDYPFDSFPSDVVPVAIEVNSGAQSLIDFEHPENPLYVFGPEDGSISSVMLQHCHAVVIIPTLHCLNLATAVATVLYDRKAKMIRDGIEQRTGSYEVLAEQRGFIENDLEFIH